MTFGKIKIAMLVGAGLVVALAPAAPALAAAYPPAPPGSVSVAKTETVVNGQVEFSGTGFTPFSSIQISLNGVPNQVVEADAAGNFDPPFHFTVPGTYTLTAVGTEGALGATRTVTLIVTVIPPPGGAFRPTLPFTGFNAGVASSGAAGLLGAGLLFLFAARRRRAGSAITE